MVTSPSRASFGLFELDLQTHELRKRGLKIRVQEQPCRILAILLEQPGRLVTREELRRQLWPDNTFVDFDHSLNTAIMRLRGALGDSPENPRFIETLPRRGYRFIQPVEKRTDPSAPGEPRPQGNGSGECTGSAGPAGGAGQGLGQAASASPTNGRPAVLPRMLAFGGVVAAAAVVLFGLNMRHMRKPILALAEARPIRSLAVLPLENVSGDKSQEYLADGITQELVTDLAKIRALTVISGPSGADYGDAPLSIQQIARQLQADAVVEGTLLRSGNQVRITAELVQAATGRYLWADSYEAQLGNILQLENKVARAIANQTRIEVTPEERERLTEAPTVEPKAYDDYVKGLYYWNQRSQGGLARATRYFRKAIGVDPQYALAYAGLADCYAIVGSTVVSAMPPKEAAPKAEAAALKAIQLDDNLAEAHTALATMQFNYGWDWLAAEGGFKRAIELNPGYATAHQRYSLFLMAMGRAQESLAEIRRARELDPLSLSINFSLGWRLYLARHYSQAIEQLRTTSEMDPGFALAHLVLGEAYEQRAHYHKAIAELEKAVAISHGSPLMESELGRAYAVAGERLKAENVLAKLREQSKLEYVSQFRLAIIYAALGEKDEAISSLEKARKDHANGLIFIKVDPELDSLRSDPRFQRLFHQLHLPA